MKTRQRETQSPAVNPLVVFAWLLLAGFTGACKLALKVPEFKTARTELEEQVLGDYHRLDDDLVLVSTVRGASEAGDSASRVSMARLNQKFNLDDIEELKNSGVLGEMHDGTLGFVPSEKSGLTAPAPSLLRLAKIVLLEENEDRKVLWLDQMKSDSAPGMSLMQVRSAFAASQRKLSKPGQWFQNSELQWVKK